MLKNFLVTNKSNIRYLSNFTGSAGFMLIAGRTKYLFTDFRYIERAKSSIKKGIKLVDITRVWRNPKDLKANWGKILAKHKITELGIEESDLSVSRFKHFKKISPKVKFKDASLRFASQRETKTPEEIKFTKKSQAINEKVFKEVRKMILSKSNLTEIELAWKIKELGAKYGADDVSFDPIVAAGKHSALPHHAPDKTKIRKGDLVLIDMGMKYQGYCSDMTRMVFTKKPTAKQAEIYNLVLAAQLNGIKKIKAGITGATADKFSRSIIEEAGYGEQYGHSGGHGVGLDIHELPNLSEKYSKQLKKNSIITVEPGIYLPGQFGVRIEDMLLVKAGGNENLTKITKKL